MQAALRVIISYLNHLVTALYPASLPALFKILVDFFRRAAIIYQEYIRKVVRGMERSKFLCALELFPGSDLVRRFSFEAVNTRGQSAHFQDCFECLAAKTAG